MNITGTTNTAAVRPASIAEVRRAFDKSAQASIDLSTADTSGATVAIFDVFTNTPEKGLWHGDEAYSVLRRGGVDEKKIAKFDNRLDVDTSALLSGLCWNGPDSANDRVNAYIELSAVNLLQRTNSKLEQILADPKSHIRVISQSQGQSRADIYTSIEPYLLYTPSPEKAKDGDKEGHAEQQTAAVASCAPEPLNAQASETGQCESGTKPEPKAEPIPSALGETFGEALGVPNPTDNVQGWASQMRQLLIGRIDYIVSHSELLQKEQKLHEELLDKLRERGVMVVTSAGNNADELFNVRNGGLRANDNFDDDITSVGHKMVVGAIDPKDLNDPNDDQVAFFSSQYDNVNIYALGVNVPTDGGPATGTSFAAPAIAAAAEKLAEANPGQSLTWIEDQLHQQFPFHP